MVNSQQDMNYTLWCAVVPQCLVVSTSGRISAVDLSQMCVYFDLPGSVGIHLWVKLCIGLQSMVQERGNHTRAPLSSTTGRHTRFSLSI